VNRRNPKVTRQLIDGKSRKKYDPAYERLPRATTTQTCSSCADSSAEWIAEAPSGSTEVYPLSNFHTWSTSEASVTSGSSGVISSFPDDELTMIDSSGAVKAQPGSLNGSGNGFTVAWERSS
jgi:hypothetical protein